MYEGSMAKVRLWKIQKVGFQKKKKNRCLKHFFQVRLESVQLRATF